MNASFTSVFTLLACLALPLLRLRSALMLVALASFVGAYAIGSAEGAHVLPGPIVAACYCGWLAIRLLARGLWTVPMFPGRRLLLPFLAYAVLVTLAAPLIFGGRILVIQPGAISEGIREATPLHLSGSSFAQLSYLVFDAVLLCAAVRGAMRPGYRIGWVVQVFLVLATVFGLGVSLEALLNVLGVPVNLFDALMGDRFGDFRRNGYSLEGAFDLPIVRGQAIFGEPSFFAAFMTGAAGASLIQFRAKPNRRGCVQLVLIVSGLLLAFSTTAVVAFALVAVMTLFVPLNAGEALARRATPDRRVLFRILFGLVAIVLVVAVFKSDAVFDYLFGKLSNTEGYEDGNYSSGAERLFWDLTAATAILNSFGVGIGAGATRASSFVMNTGAAYGLVGLLLLLAMVGLLLRALFRRARFADDTDVRAAVVLWLGWFVALAISVPDGFSLFYVWIHLGFVLGALASEQWPMPRWAFWARSARRGEERLES